MVFASNVMYAQTSKIDNNKRKLFYETYKKENIQIDYSKNAGDKLLIYAQDDYERALSYIVKAETKYSDCDYIKAVEFAEISKNYANKTDSSLIKTRILHSLIASYRRAGLVSESEESWKEFKTVVKKIPKHYQEINLLYTQSKIYDIDENYCEAAKVKAKFLQIEQHIEPNSPYRKHYDFSILSQIAYNQIKCGNYEKAKKTIAETETIFKAIKPTKPILLQEFMYLNKALLCNFNKDNENTKKYFDSAYTLANKKTNKVILKLILKERIDANVDDVDDLLFYSKIVQKITQSEITLTKNLTSSIANQTKKNISGKDSKIKIYYLLFVFVVTIGMLSFFFQRKSSKRLAKRYQQIIQEIETSSKQLASEELFTKNDGEKDIIKNLETEKRLVNSLLAFENKNQFTLKGISLAQMSVILKTNTKYLTYILKKYRNSDFPKYINTCRINFIVKELHNNPQLFQYKIAAIADLCGYSSHSQFATIFKLVKGISPSQYIDFLEKDKAKNA